MKSNFVSYPFYKDTSSYESVYLLLYVDDKLLICHDKKEIDKIKSKLKFEFKMKELGQTRRIIGMKFKRERERIYILYMNQFSYLTKVLEKFSV